MKPDMQAKVDKYATWPEKELDDYLHWRIADMQADQSEIAAMRKAQRIQRKRGGDRNDKLR